MRAKIQNFNQKTNLQNFIEGSGFGNITQYPNMVVVKLPNPSYIEDAFLRAQERLNVLCLPLRAERTGKLSNTFIVRDIEENSFERLSEQFHVVHKIEGEVCNA